MADRVIREAYLAIREARKLLSRNTIRCAMPRQDAYSSFWDGDRQTEEPTYPPDQKWYHRSDHDLPAGTILTPGGGKSKWEQAYKDRGEPVNDQDWVWMTSPEQTDFSEDTGDDFGKHLYEIQPLDEGPYPWNNLPFEHVAPRARIIRKVDPRAAWSEFSRTFKKNASKSLSSNTIRCASDDDLILYHGTGADSVPHIQQNGLMHPPSVSPAGWPMLTTSFDQAKAYATRDNPVVLEYHVPANLTYSLWRTHRTGEEPYLWDAQDHSAYDYPAQSYALKRPLPASFLHAVHSV